MRGLATEAPAISLRRLGFRYPFQAAHESSQGLAAALFLARVGQGSVKGRQGVSSGTLRVVVQFAGNKN